MAFWADLISTEWFRLVAPPVVIVLSLVIGLIVRNVIYRYLIRWAEKTRWRADDVIIGATRGVFLLWCVIAGVYISLGISRLSPHVMSGVNKVLLSLLIISVTLVVTNITIKLIQIYSQRVAAALPVTTLTQNLTKLTILGLGLLILLNTLGISITPLLTTLGIGGLAVALALQDTLSNLFAGFYTTMAKNIRVGDYVKLETGEEGYVTDIGWRATKIRQLPNNIILVPNAKLAQTIVTNYYLPEQEMAVLVQVGVDYASDLEHVERVTIEVAREVMKEVPGGIPDFEPFIRYHTFSDFSINFTVILRAKEFVDNYLVKHEFIKRLHERYNKEGIVIPFPIRTVHMKSERAGRG